MKHQPFMQSCQLCHSSFRFGPSVYGGKHIARYNLTDCRGCYQGNAEGWGPMVESEFLLHLQRVRIAVPERNADGWFPRD